MRIKEQKCMKKKAIGYFNFPILWDEDYCTRKSAGRLCDFCEILACRRWVWWGVSSQFTETKNYVSACNAKSKVGRAKYSI